MRRTKLLLGLAVSLLHCAQASAVIIYQNPHRNLRAPTGSLANSGWQWQGEVGAFPATAISKKFILAAGHVQGAVGDNYTFGGVNHRIVNYWQDPDSDLRIFQVAGTLNTWAPLYRGSAEANNTAMIYGQGTPRGDPVFVNGQAKGWQWAQGDYRLSWGRNAINGFTNGGDNIGSLLTMTFDEKGPAYEATISEGDSGGGVFIKTAAGWQLAGVNYGVESNFSLTASGTAFRASIFDRGGLYENGKLVSDTKANLPQAIYATRVSQHTDWIDDVLAGRIDPTTTAPGNGVGITVVPEPAGTLIGSAGIALLASRRRRRH